MIIPSEAIDYCIWSLRQYIFENRIFDSKILPLAKIFSRFPQELALTTTNLCNLKCIWCPNKHIKSKGVMGRELYEKIVNEFIYDYRQFNKRILFGEFGEPFVDKNFTDRIDYIRKINSTLPISLFTNGYALNKEIAAKLIENKAAITISLDEVEPDLYFKVKGKDFNVVFNNVLDFIDLAKLKNHNLFEVQVKTLMSRKEINKSKNFHLLKNKTRNIHLRFMQGTAMQNWAGSIDKNKLFDKIGLHKKPPHRFIKEKLNVPCIRLFTTLQVNYDGKVHLCCKDMLGKVILGDLNENSIKEVWQGGKIENIRNTAIGRQRNKIPLCNICDFLRSWRYLKGRKFC
ncbi:MAG: radical SAM protein [bacterium]